MKILVIGQNAREEILISTLLKNSKVDEIFCAPGNPSIASQASCVNINLDDINSFVCFAQENKIDLTITFNEYVIAKGIADVFKQKNLNIFAPLQQSALVTMNKINAKRFMSRYSIPSVDFEIFDKEQSALECAKNLKYPILIRVPDLVEEDSFYCETFLQARKNIIKLFSENNRHIILEEFIEGETFTLPVITDVYNVLPLPYTRTYKRLLDGDGGDFVKPIGATAPFTKVNSEIEKNIAQNIIFPFLDAMQLNDIPYEGVLSFDFVMNEKEVILTDIIPTIDNVVAATVFPLIEDDICDIVFAVLNGALGDIYPSIKTNDINSLSLALLCSKKAKDFYSDFVIEGIENIEDNTVNVFYNETSMNSSFDILAKGFRPIILNSTASTLTKAREKIYSAVSDINFENISYRKDIGIVKNSLF